MAVAVAARNGGGGWRGGCMRRRSGELGRWGWDGVGDKLGKGKLRKGGVIYTLGMAQKSCTTGITRRLVIMAATTMIMVASNTQNEDSEWGWPCIVAAAKKANSWQHGRNKRDGILWLWDPPRSGAHGPRVVLPCPIFDQATSAQDGARRGGGFQSVVRNIDN